MPAKSYSKIYEYDGYIIRGLAYRCDLDPIDDNAIAIFPSGIGYSQFLSEHLETAECYILFIDILDKDGKIDYVKCLHQADYSDIAYNGILNFIDYHVQPEIVNCIREYKFED